jgi:hypothetical protein
MSQKRRSESDPAQTRIYQIRIKGHLNRQWEDWFEGLTITLEDNGDTLLCGPVIDQAALYGWLKKVRDLGIPLISVNSSDLNQAGPVQPARSSGQPAIPVDKTPPA